MYAGSGLDEDLAPSLHTSLPLSLSLASYMLLYVFPVSVQPAKLTLPRHVSPELHSSHKLARQRFVIA